MLLPEAPLKRLPRSTATFISEECDARVEQPRFYNAWIQSVHFLLNPYLKGMGNFIIAAGLHNSSWMLLQSFKTLHPGLET